MTNTNDEVPKELQKIFTPKEYEDRGWKEVIETNERNRKAKLNNAYGKRGISNE